MSGTSETEIGANPDSPDPYRRILWFILFAGVLLRLYLMYSTHAAEEDFYITLRYAENIAHGNGFVYNTGQHVLGTTTPLYTLLLALIARFNYDPVVYGRLLGIGADALSGYFTYRLGRASGRPVSGLAAAICLGFAPINLVWSIKGMEVGLVAAAAAATWCAWAERREMACWAAAAILVLLRIDGIALAGVMLGATLIRDRRLPWRGVALFILLICPWMLFASLYFGSPIPMSLGAKLAVYGRLIPGRFPQLVPFLTIMLHNGLGMLMAAGSLLYAVNLVLLCRSARQQQRSVPPETQAAPALLWIAVYYSGMALSHVVLFGWYFVPPTPIYYLVSMIGISMAAERVGWGENRAGYRRVAIGAATVTMLLMQLTAPRTAATLRAGQAVEADLRIPIGVWIREHAKQGDTLMLEPIGYIGYYSEMQIIDEIGLISPEALPSYRPTVLCPGHDLWWRLRPDWLLLRAGELKSIAAGESLLPAAQRMEASYDRAQEWADPQNPSRLAFFLYHRR